jgi:hypothetical protein
VLSHIRAIRRYIESPEAIRRFVLEKMGQYYTLANLAKKSRP